MLTGILGGTFDPIHMGHIQLAENALERTAVEEIVFIPTVQPPHKQRPAASFDQRVEMVQLAITGRDGMSCSKIEERLPLPSYTCQTLQEYTRTTGVKELAFIVGLDTFYDIQTWKQYKTILQTTHFIVSYRIGENVDLLYSFLDGLGYIENTNQHWEHGKFGTVIQILKFSPVAYSSTIIKKTIKAGSNASKMLPSPVYKYIINNCLY